LTLIASTPLGIIAVGLSVQVPYDFVKPCSFSAPIRSTNFWIVVRIWTVRSESIRYLLSAAS
jgi:hypothetical protein